MHLEMNGSLYVPFTTKYAYPLCSLPTITVKFNCYTSPDVLFIFAVFIIFTLFIKKATVLWDQMDQSTNMSIAVWQYD